MDANEIRSGQRTQPPQNNDPILALHPHHVGHGSNGGQRAVPGEKPLLIAGATQSQHQLQRHAYPGQMLKGIGTVGPVGVHHGHGAGERTLALVVVGDHHVKAYGVCKIHFLRTGDAAVHRHHQGGPLVPEGLDRLAAQPVSVLNAPGNVAQALDAAAFQIVKQQDGGGDAVHVVVTENGDGLVVGHCAADASHRLAHIRHDKRGESQHVVALQPLGGFLRRRNATACQNRRQKGGITRLTQGVHRARHRRADVPFFKFQSDAPPFDRFCGTNVLFSKITKLLYQSSLET
ncbi:hypothetical protein SDC9_74501 [bioreactor metagenome]|uniref:Uncharacterized protein n=1 Tax=bioreactor metagenome TaxID=1076179 RepID=A0A644YPF3_9ZZZZ